MNFEASHKTIKTVFSGDKKYIIPRFQREYSWGKEELTELWVDVLNCIQVTPKNDLKSTDYFIGTLVLIGNENSDTLKVIDGQQRLTTLTILISALVEKFKTIDSINNAKGLYKYIEGSDLEDKKFFKLDNEVSKPFLQVAIQNYEKEMRDADEDEKQNLKYAFDFFLKRLSLEQLRNEFDEKFKIECEYIKLLEVVRDQVLSLGVIFVTADSEDGAYDIFETLNARGLGLSTVDLIKNDLFRTMKTEHPDDYAKTIWKEIRESLGEGKDSVKFDTFFRHFWLSKFEYRTENGIYKSFRTYKTKGKISAREFMSELLKESIIYNKITNPDYDEWKPFNGRNIYLSLEAVNKFKLTQIRTLLMGMIYLFDEKIIGTKELTLGLSIIEKFHFIFSTICSMRPSGLEIKYSSIARKVRTIKSKSEFNLVINELKDYYEKKLPEKSYFMSKLKEVNFTRKKTKDSWLVKYIFESLESKILGNLEVAVFDCSIEHIAPESTKDEKIKKEIGTLGNLILLDRNLNSDAGNKELEKKLDIYKKSNFKHVENFVKECNSSSWSLEQISDRQNRISEQLWEHFSSAILK